MDKLLLLIVLMAGHLLFLFPIFELVAQQKRSKIYFVLRKLGMNEKLYFLSVFSIAVGLAAVSNFLGVLTIKLFVATVENIWNYIGYLPWFMIQFTASMSVAASALFFASFISQESIVAFVVIEFMMSYLWWLPIGSSASAAETDYSAEWVIRNVLGSRYQIFHTPGYEIGLMTSYALKAISTVDMVKKLTNQEYYFGVSNLFQPFYANVDLPSDVRNLTTLEQFVFRMKNNNPLSSLVILWISIFLRLGLGYAMNKFGFGIKEYAGNKFDKTRRELQDNPDITNFKVQGLEKSYGGGKKALSDFTVEFSKGNIYAILGHNGAGKSTLFNVLTGLMNATAGTAVLFGHDVLADNKKIRLLAGVCHQDDILFPSMNAKEHFELYCDFRELDLKSYGGLENYTREMLTKVGLQNVISERISKYSGGMKRRLSLLLATVGRPPLYFLDEPTAGLDPISKKLVWNVIEELKKESIVILTSHDMEEADKLASQIIIMSGGKMIAMGSPLTLKNQYANGICLALSKSSQKLKSLTALSIQAWTKSILPFSRFISGTEQSIKVGIPRKSFEVLSPFLELMKQENLLSWSIGNSTLEEVFFNCINENYTPLALNDDLMLGPLTSLLEYCPDKDELRIRDNREQAVPNHTTHKWWIQFKAQFYKIAVWWYNDFVVLLVMGVIYAYFFFQILDFVGKASIPPLALTLFLLPLPFVVNVIKANTSDGLIEYQLANGVKSTYFWLALFLFFSVFSIITSLFTMILPVAANSTSFLIIPLTAIALLGMATFIALCVHQATLISWAIVCFSKYGNDFDNLWFSLFPPFGISKFSVSLLDKKVDYMVHAHLSVLGSVLLLLLGLLKYYLLVNTKITSAKCRPKGVTSEETKIDVAEIDIGVKDEITTINHDPFIPDTDAYRLMHLTKCFGSKIVVNDLLLRLVKNQTFGLLGVSGAGKSTTISMIVNLISPTKGYVEFPPRGGKVGYCPQENLFFDFLTISQHLRYYSMLNGAVNGSIFDWVSMIASQALLDSSMLSKFPEELSGGMRRRVMFAIALASGRTNLLLDEPTVFNY